MITVDLIGCDGSIWHLTDRTSPVSLSTGMGGLHLPSTTQYWIESAGLPGKEWRGSRMKEREFVIPVLVGDLDPPYRTGDDWTDLDGTWWDAWSTDATCTLIVNGQRKLNVRLSEDNDFIFDKDPSLFGKAKYGINVVAESPAWKGDAVTTPFLWTPTDTTDYYGGLAGFGPPFIISEADLFRSAYVSNPGDLPSREGQWIFTGPASIVSFGIGDRVNTLPFSLHENDMVIIDIANETITDSQGNNLWTQMGFAKIFFDAIPHGDAVPIVLGMQNAGQGASVTLTITPWFRRAWGASPNAVVTTAGGGGLGVGALGHDPLGH